MLFDHTALIIFIIVATLISIKSDSIPIRTLFNRQVSLLRPVSSNNPTSKAIRHNCSSSCVGRYTFDGPLERPANCTGRIQSFQCVAQIDILFESRLAFVSFVTTGTEFNSDSIEMILVQQTSASYFTNVTYITMIFTCFTTDDCDWAYAQVYLRKMFQLNLVSFFAPYRSLLFDSTSGSISQCYAQNNPTACVNGRCLATVLENSNSYINRSCALNIADVQIDVIRLRVYPTPNSLSSSYFMVTCNRNLCNNATNENILKAAIIANSSLFEPPSSTATSKGTSLNINKSIFSFFSFLIVSLHSMNFDQSE